MTVFCVIAAGGFYFSGLLFFQYTLKGHSFRQKDIVDLENTVNEAVNIEKQIIAIHYSIYVPAIILSMVSRTTDIAAE